MDHLPTICNARNLDGACCRPAGHSGEHAYQSDPARAAAFSAGRHPLLRPPLPRPEHVVLGPGDSLTVTAASGDTSAPVVAVGFSEVLDAHSLQLVHEALTHIREVAGNARQGCLGVAHELRGDFWATDFATIERTAHVAVQLLDRVTQGRRG